jgi:O-antigen/teichoic acid export membrane protein
VAAGDRAVLSALARGGGGALLLRILSVGIGFSSGVLLARAMGSDGYGLYSYAITWSTLLTAVAGLRTDSLIVRGVAAFHAKKDWAQLKGLISRFDRVVIAASSGLTAVAAVIAWIVAPYNDSVDAPTFLFALLLLPLLALAQMRQAVLQGLQQIVTSQAPDVLVRQGLIFLLVGAVWLSRGGELSPALCMALHVVAAAASVIVLVHLARRALPEEARSATGSIDMREWYARLVPLITTGILMALHQQASTIMIGAMAQPRDVGIYAAATRYGSLLSYVLISLNAPLGPIVARLHSAGEREQLQRTLSRSNAVVVAATLPMVIGTVLFADWMLALFGADFVDGTLALRILAVGHLLSVASGSVGTVLLMTGHEKENAWGVAISATLNIALNVVLIPRWGIEGAAAATAISMIARSLVLLVFLWKRLGMSTSTIGARLLARLS